MDRTIDPEAVATHGDPPLDTLIVVRPVARRPGREPVDWARVFLGTVVGVVLTSVAGRALARLDHDGPATGVVTFGDRVPTLAVRPTAGAHVRAQVHGAEGATSSVDALVLDDLGATWVGVELSVPPAAELTLTVRLPEGAWALGAPGRPGPSEIVVVDHVPVTTDGAARVGVLVDVAGVAADGVLGVDVRVGHGDRVEEHGLVLPVAPR